jgi:hypothetical protein
MRIVLWMTIAAVLAGCATPAERSVKMQHEADKMVVIYGPACEKLGYKSGTDPWRNCILRLYTNDTFQQGYTVTNCY